MARLRNSWIGHQAMPEFHTYQPPTQSPKPPTPNIPQVQPGIGGTGGTAINPVQSGGVVPPSPTPSPAGPTYPPIPVGPPAFPTPVPVDPNAPTQARTKLVNSVMGTARGGSGGGRSSGVV